MTCRAPFLLTPHAIELDRFDRRGQPRHAVANLGAIVVGDERNVPERPAGDLRHRHAGQFFAGAIETHDASLRVEHHDEAGRRVEDRGDEVAFGTQLRLGHHAIGDVARHPLEAFDAAAGDDRAHVLADPDFFSILLAHRKLEIRGLPCLRRLLVKAHHPRHPVRAHQLEVLHREQFAFAEAENAGGDRIDEREPSERIGPVDHVARVVDEVAVAAFGAFDRLGPRLHLPVQRAVPHGAAGDEQQHQRAAEREHERVALEQRLPHRAAQVLFHQAIELAVVLESIERDAQRRDDVLAAAQNREVIRTRNQRHLDGVVRERSHQEPHRQVIAGDAVDLAAFERANLVLARRDHRQRRPPRFRQRGEQLVVDRVLVNGDAQAPQVVEAARIPRQARPHHHDLRQGPGLIEQLITGRAILRVRKKHDVGLAGVEVPHPLFARAQAHVDRHARLARQGADQMNVESFRLALRVEIFVGRKLLIASVDERSR